MNDKIKVRKPDAYLEIPTPAPPNGSASPPLPFVADASIPEGVAEVRGPYNSVRITNIEPETPKSHDSAIVDAIVRIARVTQQRIAYHESALRSLREALGNLSALTGQPRQPVAPVPENLSATLDLVLATARQLEENQS